MLCMDTKLAVLHVIRYHLMFILQIVSLRKWLIVYTCTLNRQWQAAEVRDQINISTNNEQMSVLCDIVSTSRC